MKIGDLIYNGVRISDIRKECESGIACEYCKYRDFKCSIRGFSDEKVELPPIIKAADVTTDAVNPAHYKTGKYECIDVMIDIFGIEAVKTFCKLNAFKYIWRADAKNGAEDIEKAQAYIDRFVEMVSANNRKER